MDEIYYNQKSVKRKMARELDRKAVLCAFNGGHKWEWEWTKRYALRVEKCLKCGSRRKKTWKDQVDHNGNFIEGEWKPMRRARIVDSSEEVRMLNNNYGTDKA